MRFLKKFKNCLDKFYMYRFRLLEIGKVLSLEINSREDKFAFDVKNIPRGLYYLSIRHESDYSLTGPRLTVQRPHFETDDHIFTFVRRDQKEFFGTVLIVNEIEAINFYPSKLPCKVSISECSLRRINSFARDYIYGETFVRSKIFGMRWTIQRVYEDFLAWMRRLVKGGKDDSYSTWWKLYGNLSEAQIKSYENVCSSWLEKKPLGAMPTFVFVFNIEGSRFDWCINTLNAFVDQIYPHWELKLAGLSRLESQQGKRLIDAIDAEPRIEIWQDNDHLDKLSNYLSNLEGAASQYFFGFYGGGTLSGDALYHMVAEVVDDPSAGLIYSDHDFVDSDHFPVSALFKPDWNYDLFCATDYISEFFVTRCDTLSALINSPETHNNLDTFDLILRASERLSRTQIRHIPRVLYHKYIVDTDSENGFPELPDNLEGRQAILARHLAREEVDAYPSAAEITGTYRIHYRLPSVLPRVSIIIPTRNNLRVLENCVESIIKKTIYTNYEILIIDNGSDDEDTMHYLSVLDRSKSRVLHYPGEFNFSALNNFAVENTDSEFLVLLNNDTEVCNEDWLKELVSQASRPDVGAVGAKLFYAEEDVCMGSYLSLHHMPRQLQ